VKYNEYFNTITN